MLLFRGKNVSNVREIRVRNCKFKKKKNNRLMLKWLSLDKGKKKKREVANVSLLNKKYSYFVGNIYAIFKRNSFTKLGSVVLLCR